MNASSNELIAITNDSTLLNDLYGITEKERHQIQKAYNMALNPKQSHLKIIQDLINKYPQAPHFSNYLSVVYNGLGQIEKAHEVTLQIVLKHPQYLYGKLNLANKMLDEAKYETIPDILGEELELSALYPERDTFHIDEVLGFYQFTARYYLKIDDIDCAQECYDYLNEIAPESETTKSIFASLMAYRMSNMQS